MDEKINKRVLIKKLYYWKQLLNKDGINSKKIVLTEIDIMLKEIESTGEM